jgi:Ni/Fe-hydrogenase subunit HybB-like protein
VNFLISAVAVGFAMIIIERTLSAWAFKRPVHDDLLRGVAGIAVGFVWIYVVFRSIDVGVIAAGAAATGDLATRFGGPAKSAMFFTEMALGFVLPAVLLTSAKVRAHTVARLGAALLLMGGLAFNRLNVAFLGMNMDGTYVPSLIEVLVTVATVAAMLFFYIMAVKLLPIYEAEAPTPESEESGRQDRVRVPAATAAAM